MIFSPSGEAVQPCPLNRRRRTTSSPYLSLHRSSLIFRIRIPAELQPCLGKTEYRRSIGRCYAREAKLCALRLATAALEVFSLTREALQARRPEELTHSHETGKGSSGQNGSGYTPLREYREISQVAQDVSTSGNGYTSDLQGRTLASLTDDEIRSIAENALLSALKGGQLISIRAIQEQILLGGNTYEKLKPIAAAQQKAGKEAMDQAADYARHEARCHEEFQRGDLSEDTARMTDMIFASDGIQMNPETESYAALEAVPPMASIPYILACQAILEANVSYYRTRKEQAKGQEGIYNAEIERLEARQEERREKRRRTTIAAATAAPQPPQPSLSPQPQQPQKTLKEALEDFMDDRVLEGKWSDSSRKRAMSKYELFQAIVDPDGTLPVSALNVDLLTRYKKTLFGFPANRSKKAVYRDISLPVVLADAEAGRIPQEDRLDQQTVTAHCQTVIAFMTWARDRALLPPTATSGVLRIPKKQLTEDSETRDPFSIEDIQKLFSPELYLRAGVNRPRGDTVGASPSRFWVPLLGLFTGARLEELAQLHLDDLVLVNQTRNVRRLFPSDGGGGDGVSIPRRPDELVCLHINKGKPFQKLKNAASQRYVPLSPVLIDDLGFLDYAALVISKATLEGGDGRLFPELRKTPGVDKFSHKLSHWFLRYRRGVDVGTGEEEGKKVFHSFRNTIGFWCDQQGTIQQKAAARYLGHAVPGITFRTYSKDTLPHILYQTITEPFTQHIKGFLDVDGLKASPFTQCGERSGLAATGGGGDGEKPLPPQA